MKIKNRPLIISFCCNCNASVRKKTKEKFIPSKPTKMEKPSFWLSKRYLVGFVLFLNFIDFQILRNNISIAVVEMTTSKWQSDDNLNSTASGTAEFNWDSAAVGLIISMSPFGGLFSFLGGFLVNYFGGAMTGSLCLLISGVITLLHPIALYTDFRLFLACRFIMGIFESFFYASSGDISVRWFHKNERSTLIAITFNGVNVGTAVVYPLCGYLAYAWGWQMVFYVTGAISLFTSIFSMVVIRNQPSQDRWISKKELQYLAEGTDDIKPEINHSYKKILKSKPIWCLAVVSFSYMWISSVLGSCLPLYIQDMTRKNIHDIGLISSIPNIAFIFANPLADVLMNHWRNNSSYSITRIYKIAIVLACVSTTVSLAIVGLSDDFFVSMISFVSMEVETAFMIVILQIIPVFLHPSSSSFTYGLLLVFFSLGAIIAQSVTCLMIPNHTKEEWNECFFLASIILLFSAVIFALYGSSETQSWSNTQSRKQSVVSIGIQNGMRRLSIINHPPEAENNVSQLSSIKESER